MKALAICLALLTVVQASNEEFREHLHLRHLDDGRVSALFSFTTLLKDIAPRSPDSLGEDDTRKSVVFMVYVMVTEVMLHAQLSITHYFHLLWVKFCESTPSPSFI